MVVVVVVVVVGTIGDLELDHGNPNLMRYHQLWLQKVSSSVGSIIETVMFDCVHLHCEVDHEDSKSCMLMMNHYHTNFGYKKLSSSEDITDKIRTHTEMDMAISYIIIPIIKIT